jgi:hypothetical protein
VYLNGLNIGKPPILIKAVIPCDNPQLPFYNTGIPVILKDFTVDEMLLDLSGFSLPVSDLL